MTAAVPEMTHPTDETLAAFADATLSAPERQEVLKHMAECADCREVVMWTTEFQDVEAPAGNVKPFPWKKVVPLAAAAAIAVTVTVLLLRPTSMDEVVKQVTEVTQRPNAARLDLDIPYQQPRSPTRGGAEVGSDYTEFVALDAASRAAADPTVENLHAAGIAYMYDGEFAKAVELLERAGKAESTPSVALLNNLTAAYLAWGRSQQALATADRSLAIEQTLVALWNRALALEWAGRDDEARAAWNKYLQHDSDSEWAKEVREKHLTNL